MKKNKLYKIIKIVLILCGIIYSQTPNVFEENQQLLSNENNKKKLLNNYIDLFEKDQNNYEYLKKIKEILIEEKEFKKLILFYEKYLNSIYGTNKYFEIKVELLEIKIWGDTKDWKDFLNLIINDSEINQTKIEYILYRLIQNKKINEAYQLTKNIRIKYNIPHFFSKKLISVFKNNNRYKDSIEESFIYLIHNPNISHNNNSIANKIIIDHIFNFCDKLLEETLINNFFLPISSKQLSANTFLNSNFYAIQKIDDINYIIEIYEKLIEHNINYENSKIKLADINYRILNDFDKAYNIYDEIEKKSSRVNIDTEAVLGKINILISKGYLDSAQTLISNQKNILDKFTSHLTKQNLLNQLNYKSTQILFYKGKYEEMNSSLDSLIKKIELKNKDCNDLLEVKTISLFFKQDQEDFKKYSTIQYKIKMNKSFESILELIQLMETENILINELAQFQYMIIELEKGNLKNVQQIISSMNQKTVFYELSLIINAEIEDHIYKNYNKAIKLYEGFIEKYPNSIYKENILKRLNEIYKLLMEDLDS